MHAALAKLNVLIMPFFHIQHLYLSFLSSLSHTLSSLPPNRIFVFVFLLLAHCQCRSSTSISLLTQQNNVYYILSFQVKRRLVAVCSSLVSRTVARKSRSIIQCSRDERCRRMRNGWMDGSEVGLGCFLRDAKGSATMSAMVMRDWHCRSLRGVDNVFHRQRGRGGGGIIDIYIL